jgi:ABC-type multidrug transport system fused ATPase/permease subunit
MVAGVAILVTSWAAYAMTKRLFTTSERGLATLRIKAFRHVHDLPLLTQNTERRGALVAAVTSDVDQVSQFLVFGGLLFVVSVGQMLVATVIMAIYSWQLAIVVWVCFAPLFLSLRYFQRKLSTLRHRTAAGRPAAVGDLRVRSWGPPSSGSYAIEARTQRRIDEAISGTRRPARARRASPRSRSRWRGVRRLAQRRRLIVGIGSASPGDHRRQGAGLRVPRVAVRRAGADGHPDPHRRGRTPSPGGGG